MTGNNRQQSGLHGMSELSETRLWKVLDGMTAQLSEIQGELKEVAALTERVNNHGDTLKRFGNDIDELGKRTHNIELALANNKILSRQVGSIETKIGELEKDHDQDFKELKETIARDRKKLTQEMKQAFANLDLEIEQLQKAIETVKSKDLVDDSRKEVKDKIKSTVFNKFWQIVSSVLIAFILWKMTGNLPS